MSSKENKIVHPQENESFTDIINRFMNEMDFVGQEKARKFCFYVQILSSVSANLIS